jgi:hypothetical protein
MNERNFTALFAGQHLLKDGAIVHVDGVAMELMGPVYVKERPDLGTRREPLTRYTPIETPDGDDVVMMRYVRGEWVRYADVASLLAERERLQNEIAGREAVQARLIQERDKAERRAEALATYAKHQPNCRHGSRSCGLVDCDLTHDPAACTCGLSALLAQDAATTTDRKE